MNKPVKTRHYDASRRREAAWRTRGAILAAAASLFVERGYAGATMADIAAAAGVALDTVYHSVGPKPALFRILIERAISDADDPIPAEERDYVRAIHATPDAHEKIAIYAASISQILPRLAPLFRVLNQAAPAHPEIAEVWQEIAERRARNMRQFAAELAAAHPLREGLSIDDAADIIWATNASEFYLLLVQDRGWTPEQYRAWLVDAWERLLLADD